MNMAFDQFEPDAAEALVGDLFPATVSVAVAYPWAPAEGLMPPETAGLDRMVPARRREFAAGRRAARQAMARLGHPGAAVPAGDDRAPRWPPGLVGSLSHTGTLCMAAVAREADHETLGLDIEEVADLPPDLLEIVCTPSERAWLSVQANDIRGRLARLIFSAKECAYKCQYPLSGEILEFGDLEITPDPDTGQFEATFIRPAGAFSAGSCLSGRFVIGARLIATAMALPPAVSSV